MAKKASFPYKLKTEYDQPTESERLTWRVLSLRPFKKMGKLTKLLYFVTTSEREATACDHTFIRFKSAVIDAATEAAPDLWLGPQRKTPCSRLWGAAQSLFPAERHWLQRSQTLPSWGGRWQRITYGCSHYWFLNKKTVLHSPVWGPLVSGHARLCGLGVDVNAVSHHKSRVESHPKLTDDGAAGLCLVLQGIQKCL